MTNITRSMGNDICPKCGSSELVKIYDLIGNVLNCTCKSCGFLFAIGALDTPAP